MLENRKHLPTLNQQMAVTIGQQLKATRMGRGLTLQQAADPLLLSVRQIECLEAGDSSLFYGARLYAQAADKYATFLNFDVMPSQMMLDYQTESTVTTATTPPPVKEIIPAAEIHVPENRVVTESISNSDIAVAPEIIETAPKTEPAPAKHAASQDSPPPPSRIKTAVTVIVTAAVTASLVLNANQLETFVRDQVDNMPSMADLTERFRGTPDEKPVPPAPKEVNEQAPKDAGPEADKVTVTNEQEAIKPAPMPMVSTVPTVINEKRVAEQIAEKPVTETVPAEKPTPRNVNFAVTDPKSGLMVIRFGIDSWVQAVTRNGKQRIERTYNEGDTLTVQPSNLQSLTIGNSPQVKVTTDGTKLDLTPYSKGSVARFSTEQLDHLDPKFAETAPAKPITNKPVAPTSKATETHAEQDKNMLASE